MANCPACTAAEAEPHTGHYQAKCLECAARAMAHSPAAFESHRQGRVTDALKVAVRRVFGDGWRDGLARVQAWADKLKETTP